jgi:hypothetical protein
MHKNRNLQRKNAVYHSPKKKWQRAVSSIQEAIDKSLWNVLYRAGSFLFASCIEETARCHFFFGLWYTAFFRCRFLFLCIFRDRRHSVNESPAQTS